MRGRGIGVVGSIVDERSGGTLTRARKRKEEKETREILYFIKAPRATGASCRAEHFSLHYRRRVSRH